MNKNKAFILLGHPLALGINWITSRDIWADFSKEAIWAEFSFFFNSFMEDPSTRPHLHLIGQNYATREPERQKILALQILTI